MDEMAYKNQKKNKAHNAKLKSERRKKVTRKRKGVQARINKKPLTLEEMERMISRI